MTENGRDNIKSIVSATTIAIAVGMSAFAIFSSYGRDSYRLNRVEEKVASVQATAIENRETLIGIAKTLENIDRELRRQSERDQP